MIRKIIILVAIVMVGIFFLTLNLSGRSVLAYSFFALAVIYFLLSIVVQGLISRRIKDRKTRYSISKALTVLYVLIFIGTVLVLWVQTPEVLVVSVGLIGAAGAFVLQDSIRNFIGGLAILATGIYGIGDRIEVESKLGDVVDIGLLYTTLLEMREWVDGDQATGRLTTIPNSRAISGIMNNYTKDFPFLWDEIRFPISLDSDLAYAMERFQNIVEEEREEVARMAEEAMTEVVMEKYYLTKREVRPTLYMSFNDNWVDIFVRYITRVHERRMVRSKLFQLMFEAVQGSDRIRIGSDTMTLAAVPELTIIQKYNHDS